MEEIIFLVEENPEGGYTAKGSQVSIYTQGDTIEALRTVAIDAVRCHFYDEKNRIIRLKRTIKNRSNRKVQLL